MKIDDKTQIGIYDDGEANRTIRLSQLDEPFRSQLLLFPEMRELLRQLDYFGDAFITREYEPGSTTVTDLITCARTLLAKLPPETP